MKASVEKIMKDLNRLGYIMMETEETGRVDKKKISDCLAYLTYEIREKYGLVSAIYLPSEVKACETFKEVLQTETENG